MSNNDIGSSKQHFQSDDSQGSDLSYESSLTDQADNHIGNIDFFKQEMARFFINYPELINKNILSDQTEKCSEKQLVGSKKSRIMDNWQTIAEQVLNEAKEQSISLQNLARRIALYRHKIDESDIIDLLLQQKQIILKELDSEITNQNNQDNNLNIMQKNDKIVENKNKEEANYYSWINRKIQRSKYINNQEEKKKYSQVGRNQTFSEVENKVLKKNNSTFMKSKSIDRNAESNKSSHLSKRSLFNRSVSHVKRARQLGSTSKRQSRHLDESQVSQNKESSEKHQWKHLMSFEPKTEIAKQLSQQIKKFNPKDELGIKRAILLFLDRYKDMINNQIINKVTLSQKIQKLYNEDAKELLMFYPSKINNFDNNVINTNNNLKENKVEDRFMFLLKEINEGPLMKYWRQFQESKV